MIEVREIPPAEQAYQDGIRDCRESRDDGAAHWETTRYHDDYMRGFWEEYARRKAERRGFMTGDINQTDKWFREES